MNAIIFNTEKEAMDWDFEHNTFTGNRTKYKYARVPLNTTTTLTKKQYAQLMNIPESITRYNEETGEEESIPNPKYTELQSSYTLDKYALLVGEDFALRDDEGNITGYSEDVVDVSGMLKVQEE
jgi:hypothetical protein